MKPWHWIAIAAVGLLFVWKITRGRAQGQAESGEAATPLVRNNPKGVPMPTAANVAAIANANWGMSTTPGGIKAGDVYPADQWLYPHWYRTPDGGWVNAETGEVCSPGASPISTGITLEVREKIGEEVAATNAGIAAGIAAAPTGYRGDNGEVIY